MNEPSDGIPWDVESDESPVPIAEVTDVLQREETTYLVLRVSIEGRDEIVLLSEDALTNCGLPSLEAVVQIRQIREALESLNRSLARSPLAEEIAALTVAQIDAAFHLPRRQNR
ncbi:MAG: hypothetical protein OXH64_00085 [Rhodospirillaceae bacterium]|nr:hypothetical protein [Rhodospirillaceae bacterium]MDE0616451.1 hypothetical protein [Rhodospirillaceae bacterium]MDE0716317.1 hypothetical protein [Rhodospirillaceae bacterium]